MCPESLIRLALSNVTRAALLSIQNMLFERAGTQVKKKKKKCTSSEAQNRSEIPECRASIFNYVCVCVTLTQVQGVLKKL